VNRLRHPLGAVALVLLLTVPWLAVFLTGTTLGDVATVAVTGIGVIGASFLLAWGAETAEKDVPRPFAIAVLAVLAVAPEYAVDAYYAWGAGINGATAEACAQLTPAQIEAQATALAEGCHSANLAVANMTGANRILIGLGWSGIALYTIWRVAKTNDTAVLNREGRLNDAVSLDRDISLEITFLLLATAWAFLVPLGGGIDVIDTVVLVGLYVAYIGIVIRGNIDPIEEHVGVPAYFQSWRRAYRIPLVLTLFAFSGALIFTAVEPFVQSLEHIGLSAGVPEFFMIQWIAPLASESPELIVVAILVNKARSTAGFNALISSKLNQWTLLIGTIAVVYSLGIGSVGVLPFDAKQGAEIWITAAQSFFAISILVNFQMSGREAVALFGLFISQVLIEFATIRGVLDLPISTREMLLLYAVVYVIAGSILFVKRRKSVVELFKRATDAGRAALGAEPKYVYDE